MGTLIIRSALPADTPAIVALLKRSLGESLLPKSEAIWNYKHLANPFGPSKVLVAETADRLVGVRAFMRWQWQRGQEIFNAFRAVDTATDPDLQGQGIFKRLTLQCLDELKQEPKSFVFNTPNAQSRPGYLKMGWQEVGRLPVFLAPCLSWPWSRSTSTPSLPTPTPTDLQVICDRHNRQAAQLDKWFTPKSVAYLQWRYFDNPLQPYLIWGDANEFWAGYVKTRGRLRELRVAEWLRSPASPAGELAPRQTLKRLAQTNGSLFVSAACRLPGFWFGWRSGWGPKLTLRSLDTDISIAGLSNLANWNFQLGELELF